MEWGARIVPPNQTSTSTFRKITFQGAICDLYPVANLHFCRQRTQPQISLKFVLNEHQSLCFCFNSVQKTIPIFVHRLRMELRRLRKQYQEQIEMSKREFMNVHSKKVIMFIMEWTGYHDETSSMFCGELAICTPDKLSLVGKPLFCQVSYTEILNKKQYSPWQG